MIKAYRMYGRAGLDRFKKAESLEPFAVTVNSATKTACKAVTNPSTQYLHSQSYQQQSQYQNQHHVSQKPTGQEALLSVGKAQQVTQVGGGQSNWQPPDWAIEPCSGVYYLEVLKDGEILDQINLDRRRHIFGRQFQTCDFVLDHQSVSRQHASVIPHKNGSIYVIDLGSAHGTFVANERLTKDTPVELEVGQSLRFAASTRTYILRKNADALFPRPPPPEEINLLPPPDPSDEEAVVVYNTLLNRYCLSNPDLLSESSEPSSSSTERNDSQQSGRAAKRIRRLRVSFRDQAGGELIEVVGVSDGADVETEPGPVGMKEGGSLVGKYESLVQTTLIPKGKEKYSPKEESSSPKCVTDKLQEVLNKVKSVPKGGICDNLYGDSFSGKVGSSWAYSTVRSSGSASPIKDTQGKTIGTSSEKPGNNSSSFNNDDNDLFGD